MNSVFVNTKDYASLHHAINRSIDGSFIVKTPPNMIKINDFLNEKPIYNDYSNIKIGRLEYGKNGGNLRFPKKILKIYPMQSVFIEDDPKFIQINYLWNREMNDNLYFKNVFEIEANKQLRKLDYPYLQPEIE